MNATGPVVVLEPRTTPESWLCPNCGRSVGEMPPLEHAILCCANERVKAIRLARRLAATLQFLAEHRAMTVDEALREMVARELL